MKSKLYIVLSILVSAVLLLSACAPAPAPTPEAPEPPAGGEAPAGEWTLATAAEPWKGETLRLIGEAALGARCSR